MAESSKKVTVKRVFGSFVNNATAIDGAKFSPWWVALIMLVLGLLLPILPIFVQSATTNGTSFMSSAEYGLGLDMTFGEAINSLDGTLTFDNTSKQINYVKNNAYDVNDADLIGGYKATSGEYAGQYQLRIYYKDSIVTDGEADTFIANKRSNSYKKGTINATDVGETGYIPSSIYFFKNTFYMDIYGANSAEIKASMGFTSDLKCFDYSGSDLKAYFCGASFNKDNKESRVKAVDNLKSFIDTTYKTTKTKSMWLGSLIYLGIYFVMNMFMALMIFLMSRGKNNPNNYLNFWTCMKINWWESLCPGLLGMILGFIFTGSAVMIYIMLIAMRTMWLTMRELRPQYQ